MSSSPNKVSLEFKESGKSSKKCFEDPNVSIPSQDKKHKHAKNERTDSPRAQRPADQSSPRSSKVTLHSNKISTA